MMSCFKFLSGNDFLILSPTRQLYYTLPINNYRHQNNEYCFQFDDDEPYVFGRGNNDLTITIRPTANGDITFTHNGRRFKIFAREVQL